MFISRVVGSRIKASLAWIMLGTGAVVGVMEFNEAVCDGGLARLFGDSKHLEVQLSTVNAPESNKSSAKPDGGPGNVSTESGELDVAGEEIPQPLKRDKILSDRVRTPGDYAFLAGLYLRQGNEDKALEMRKKQIELTRRDDGQQDRCSTWWGYLMCRVCGGRNRVASWSFR